MVQRQYFDYVYNGLELAQWSGQGRSGGVKSHPTYFHCNGMSGTFARLHTLFDLTTSVVPCRTN